MFRYIIVTCYNHVPEVPLPFSKAATSLSIIKKHTSSRSKQDVFHWMNQWRRKICRAHTHMFEGAMPPGILYDTASSKGLRKNHVTGSELLLFCIEKIDKFSKLFGIKFSKISSILWNHWWESRPKSAETGGRVIKYTQLLPTYTVRFKTIAHAEITLHITKTEDSFEFAALLD